MSEKLKVIIAEHAPSRSEGILEMVEDQSVDISLRRLHQGETLPKIDDIDVLISGGGPMGVYEMDDPRYEFLNKEAELMSDMIAIGKPILAICLGHQLLSKVLGSPVEKFAPRAEYGWSTIHLTAEGKADDLFSEILGYNLDSFHYHQDSVMARPLGTTLLATTEKSPIQAIRYMSKPVWGVQFHPEVSGEFGQEVLNARREVLVGMGVDVDASITRGLEANHQPRAQIFKNFMHVARNS